MNVITLPKRYPDWLSGDTKSTLEKIYYALTTRFLTRFTKQNLFDKGFAWKKQMLEELEKLHIEKPIDVLVVTGAPFSLLYYGAEFKLKHPEVIYICDLRDPWTWCHYYGIPTLSKKKKKFQEFSERKSLEGCDLFCVTTEHMGNHLKEKYPDLSEKIYELPHAFDVEKFPANNTEVKREGLIYGGTMYPGIGEYLSKVAEVIKRNPDIDFNWNIYTGHNSYPIESMFEKGKVHVSDFIPEEKLFIEIRKSAAYLAIYPIGDKDVISTKFFEIILMETPILYIGEEGEVGRFVRENRIGVHITPDKIEEELPKYLKLGIPFEKDYFDVSQYSFSNVTDEFLKVIKAKKNSNNKP